LRRTASVLAVGLFVVGLAAWMPPPASVPVPGDHLPIAGTGPPAASPRAFASAAISLIPTHGPPNITIIALGSGFHVSRNITIYFDAVAVATSPSPCVSSGQAHGGGGTFTCTFVAPVGPPGDNNVSATDGTYWAWAPYNETLLGPVLGSVDVGQTFAVLGYAFGPSLVIHPFTLGSFSLNCTGATIGKCSGGIITTNSSGDFNVTTVAPPVPASATYDLSATDSARTTHNGSIVVYLDPTITNISASPSTADVGQTVTFTATAALGSGGYSFDWSGLPGCPNGGDPLPCAPTVPGAATITVTATDSNGVSVTSNASRFSVEPAPTVATPLVDPAAVDVNQSVTFTASASNGSGVYERYNWTGLPFGCNGTTASVQCVPQFAGLSAITVAVTDSFGMVSVRSGRAMLAVAADPVANLVANRTSADVGQLVKFTASATLGSGNYAYQWTGLPPGCTGAATAVCAASDPGVDDVQVQVSDSNHYTVATPTVALRVYADPTVGLATTRPAVDVGQRLTLEATASNGSGGNAFAWTGLPHGCSGTTATVSCSPSSPGSYRISVRVRDSDGGSATSAPLALLVAVAPAIAGGISILPASPAPGENVTLTCAASGGVGALAYAWVLGDGANASGTSSVLHTYVSPGVYTVLLWVNDTVGGSAHATVQVTVAAPPPPPFGGPVGNQLPWLGVVVVLVVVVAAVWVLRRRRRGGSKAPGEVEAGPGTVGEPNPPE
jgi:hypothetical protein